MRRLFTGPSGATQAHNPTHDIEPGDRPLERMARPAIPRALRAAYLDMVDERRR